MTEMSKWYEEAVFYHMYPLGMTGAPKYNTQAVSYTHLTLPTILLV